MNQKEISIQEIQNTIRDSEVGYKLHSIDRWSRFRTHEDIFLWTKLIGPTATVLTHQEHFANFINTWGQEIEKDQLSELMLAASIHDLGEVVVGDIAAPHKNKLDEKNESLGAIDTIRQLDFDKDTSKLLIDTYQRVVAGESTYIHFLFKAFERTEYLDTAIQLFAKLENGMEMEKGGVMISKVLAFDLPSVITYAQKLPQSIGKYFAHHNQDILNMFEETVAFVEREYEADFEESRTNWERYSA